MIKTALLSLLTLTCISTYAQDMSTIIYKTDGSAVAVDVEDIDSITVEQKSAAEVTPQSKWKGKKIGFFGDSITEYGEYVNAFAALTGCTVYNYGISATHMASRNASDTNAFDQRYTKMRTALDMVIVFGGTNDFGHTDTAEFGEFTDGAQAGKYTFYAGLHRLFKGLKNKYKNKPVVIMTPIHHGVKIDTPEYKINDNGSLEVGTNATTGRPFIDYVNAIKEVAAYYSFIVLDAYSFSNLCPMTEVENAYYFKDGLHLNDKGGEKLAKWMYPQLEQVYDMFY